uniref:Uncharacterized protein n=1 Tax=Salmo trutta TaxID=8032 RepID=A0A674D4Y9_SALTR
MNCILRASTFGRPSPRHGLKLLFWFANDYIVIKNDNQMVPKYDPKEGRFGFRHFRNRPECENNVCKRLLPYDGYPFYEVGDLHLTASHSMPKYVRKYNTRKIDTSNMDRLIISMRPDMTVDKVYVTQHEDPKNFDPVNTYCISRELLMTPTISLVQGVICVTFTVEVGSLHTPSPMSRPDQQMELVF